MAKYLSFLALVLTSQMALGVTVTPSSSDSASSSASEKEDDDDEGSEPDNKKLKRQSKTKQYYDRDMTVFQKVAELLGELNGETPEGRRIRHEVGVRAEEIDEVISALQRVHQIANIAALLPEYRALLEQTRNGPRDLRGTLLAIQEMVRRGVVAGVLAIDVNQQGAAAAQHEEPAQAMDEERDQLVFEPEELEAAEYGLNNLPAPGPDPFEGFDLGTLQEWNPAIEFNFPPSGGSGSIW